MSMTSTRQAVTVFIEVDTDVSDPQHVAEAIVNHALSKTYGMPGKFDESVDEDGHDTWRWGRQVDVTGPDSDTKCLLTDFNYRGRIMHVMDAGMAAGNGYMWSEPTYKAFR